MEQFIEGFALQASLILALGAQNLFVLDSGLRRRRHLFVASLCSLCDTLLIAVGVLGAATIFVEVPWLKIAFGVLGVAFLAYYGLKKLSEKPSLDKALATDKFGKISLIIVTGQTLAFSLLNPHVYLDTVVLIGGYSAQFSSAMERTIFGAGAAAFSTLWFFGLAIFAASMNRYLHNARMMRAISFVSGIVLLALAMKLSFDVWAWL